MVFLQGAFRWWWMSLPKEYRDVNDFEDGYRGTLASCIHGLGLRTACKIMYGY